MHTAKYRISLIALALLSAGQARATEQIVDVPAPLLTAQAAAETGDGTEKVFGAVVAADTLDDFRGGSEVANTAFSTGAVQDNTAINVSAGMNTISEGAFAHASGLPIVIQNSGANVLIQNSTIVNVQFK